MRANRPNNPTTRKAAMLIEATVAVLLLAIAMTAIVRILGWVAAERREVDRREYAIREAANLMERLAARRGEGLTAEAVKRVTLPEQARRTLPGAELDVGMMDDGPDRARRVSVRLRWRTRAGTWDRPVRLTAWLHGERGDR